MADSQEPAATSMKLRERLRLYWRGYGLTERVFVLLPLLLLTPRLSPDVEVGHNGEPSQEFVITLVVLGSLILLSGEAFSNTKLVLHWSGRARWLLLATAAFALWSGASLLWTADVGATLDHSVLWFNYAAILLIGRVVLRRRSVIGLMATLVTAGGGIALFRLLQYGFSLGNRPLTSPLYKNFGVEAELLVTILPLLLVIYLTARRRALAGGMLVMAAIVLMGGLSTYQRTPILALALAFGLLALGLLLKWLLPRSNWRLATLVITLLVAGGMQMSWPAKTQDPLSKETGKDFVLKQVEGIRNLEVDTSSRLQFWATALEMARAHPVLGTGAGAYKTSYVTYRRVANTHPVWGRVQDFSQTEGVACVYRTHNEWLEILGELGVIGLVLISGLIFALAGLLWQTPPPQRWLALGVSSSALAFFISSSLTSFSFRWIPCGGLFFLLVALLLPNKKNTERRITRASSYRQGAVIAFAVLLLLACVRTGQVLSSEHFQFQAQTQSLADPAQSKALYQKALALDPYNFSASAELGALFYRNNNPLAAVHHLEYGIEHGVNDIFSHAMLSFSYAQLGQPTAARKVLQQAVEAYPGTVFTRLLYAEALAKEGQLQAANEQRAMMRTIKAGDAVVWELILQDGLKAATLTAAQQGLPHPARLEPRFGLAVIQERARLMRGQ